MNCGSQYEFSGPHIGVLCGSTTWRVHGVTDRARLRERVPTVSFTWEGRHPRDIAAALGDQGIYVWDGNYYALAATERLDAEDAEGKGGMVRVGTVHAGEAHGYTVEEIEQLGEAPREMV